jgi:hypothetical protein
VDAHDRLSIVAFRNGGPAAVGPVALIRLLPEAIAGPFLATIADRVSRERAIVVISDAEDWPPRWRRRPSNDDIRP